jgi:hypothetical protein
LQHKQQPWLPAVRLLVLQRTVLQLGCPAAAAVAASAHVLLQLLLP